MVYAVTWVGCVMLAGVETKLSTGETICGALSAKAAKLR